MKKFLGIISMATIALAGCTKTDVELAAPSTVAKTIYASVNTKTVNDGLSTKWAEGDAINVFHAEEGEDTYKNDGSFAISDVTTGAFTGTTPTLEEGVAYDWFAYYPYTSQIKTPANTNTGFMIVGSKSNSSQIQKGNSSKAHLAGTNYPLIGKATSVLAEDDVVFQMEQASAVVAINVTNSASANLQVSEVVLTAETDIVGTYYINIAGDKPIYTASGSSYVSNTAKLTVQNGEAIASESSATFYLAVKPFTAAAGETLKISVNGYEKELTLQNDVTFERGTIKTVKFEYDKATEVTDVTTLSYLDVNTTTYSGDELTFTNNGVSFGYVNVIRNNSNGTPTGWAKNQVLQLKKTATNAPGGSIYNKDAMNISSIRVYAVNGSLFTLHYGKTDACEDGSISRPTTATGTETVNIKTYENKAEGEGTADLNYYDFDLAGKDATYFKLETGSSVVYFYSVVIK